MQTIHDMKRIFIAVKIDPGPILLNMISDFRNTLKDEKIKWSETGNLHITIAFLGDTEDNKIKEVSQMLSKVCEGSGKFNMLIKGAGVFKNLKDPRVIWTGIEHSGEMNKLYNSINAGLKDIGLSPEERPFSPHLTLGRIKSIKNIDVLKSLVARYMESEIQKQQVNEVILFESILFHTGPVYKPLGIFVLGR